MHVLNVGEHSFVMSGMDWVPLVQYFPTGFVLDAILSRKLADGDFDDHRLVIWRTVTSLPTGFRETEKGRFIRTNKYLTHGKKERWFDVQGLRFAGDFAYRLWGRYAPEGFSQIIKQHSSFTSHGNCFGSVMWDLERLSWLPRAVDRFAGWPEWAVEWANEWDPDPCRVYNPEWAIRIADRKAGYRGGFHENFSEKWTKAWLKGCARQTAP